LANQLHHKRESAAEREKNAYVITTLSGNADLGVGLKTPKTVAQILAEKWQKSVQVASILLVTGLSFFTGHFRVSVRCTRPDGSS